MQVNLTCTLRLEEPAPAKRGDGATPLPALAPSRRRQRRRCRLLRVRAARVQLRRAIIAITLATHMSGSRGDCMPDRTELFEIIHTTRAMRRLKPDPVPDALIDRVLEAGQCAPNAANAQQWRFLVVKDLTIKQAVQVWYRRAFDEVMGPHYRSSPPPPGMDPERYRRQADAVEYLTDHFHEAPVWIVPCLEHGKQATTRWSGASIYPAVQNMLLAARALGLGATLTTRHLFYEKETEAALGLPPGVHSYAIIPIGYPQGKFGPVRRGPLPKVVYQDRWGQAWDGA